MSNKLAIAAIALVCAFSTLPAIAADEANTVPGLTAAGAPLGLHGVDPVALLRDGRRKSGQAKHTVVHDGVAYYLSSAANAETFKANPFAFTPENGGFCTYGVSVGKKFDGNPNYASVMNGKLYVFLNKEIFGLYKKDKQGTIDKAAGNWPKIKHTAATDL